MHYVVWLLFASICYFLITGLLFFNILSIFVFLLCIFFLFCIFCVFVMFCVFFLSVYIAVSFLFLYIFTDHCHWVESHFSKWIYHNISHNIISYYIISYIIILSYHFLCVSEKNSKTQPYYPTTRPRFQTRRSRIEIHKQLHRCLRWLSFFRLD